MLTWAAISSAFTNNPAARWIAGIGATLAFAITWLALHDRKIRQIERLKAAEQTRKATEKYTETVAKETAHEADEAIEARDTAKPLDPDGMSDAQYERIFGRRRSPTQSG